MLEVDRYKKIGKGTTMRGEMEMRVRWSRSRT